MSLKVYEAERSRDALAKTLYNCLFNEVINIIHRKFEAESYSYSIGVLDMAGFGITKCSLTLMPTPSLYLIIVFSESFATNSFEQLCINYSNEKMQQLFNVTVLTNEQELYRFEGLNVPVTEYSQNEHIISLIESQPTGIFALLNEESKLPNPSCTRFTTKVHNTWKSNVDLLAPKSLKIPIKDEDGFVIRHFIGAVCYKTVKYPRR